MFHGVIARMFAPYPGRSQGQQQGAEAGGWAKDSAGGCFYGKNGCPPPLFGCRLWVSAPLQPRFCPVSARLCSWKGGEGKGGGESPTPSLLLGYSPVAPLQPCRSPFWALGRGVKERGRKAPCLVTALLQPRIRLRRERSP